MFKQFKDGLASGIAFMLGMMLVALVIALLGRL